MLARATRELLGLASRKYHRKCDNIIADFANYALDPSKRPFSGTRIVDWLTKSQIDAVLAFLVFCTLNDESHDARAARHS